MQNILLRQKNVLFETYINGINNQHEESLSLLWFSEL
jgi:hypothetical protein